MNKARFICFLFLILLSSCSKKKDNLPRKAIGKINSISVIISDQLWNGEIGDSLRNKLASPVIGLPQEEPLFTINQYPDKILEGFITDSRTIIVVKKAAETKFVVVRNQYASPQIVFHISGRTVDDILEIVEKNTPKIIEFIESAEIKENQRIVNQSLLNPKIIENKFHITLAIPSNYKYVLHKNQFLWLKKEIVSGNSSLLLYQVPINKMKNDSDLIKRIIKMRDSIGNLYIKGTAPNTNMITDEGYSPYLLKIKLDGKDAYETRGTWELKNDFMSGPFVNYVIIDKDYSRALVLEGFLYSPSKEKRDLLQELEAIIKSVKIHKRNN